jgi:hypothetical protein
MLGFPFGVFFPFGRFFRVSFLGPFFDRLNEKEQRIGLADNDWLIHPAYFQPIATTDNLLVGERPERKRKAN